MEEVKTALRSFYGVSLPCIVVRILPSFPCIIETII